MSHVEPHLDEGLCQCDCPDCVSEWRGLRDGDRRRYCACPDCAQGDCPNWRLDGQLHEYIESARAASEGGA